MGGRKTEGKRGRGGKKEVSYLDSQIKSVECVAHMTERSSRRKEAKGADEKSEKKATDADSSSQLNVQEGQNAETANVKTSCSSCASATVEGENEVTLDQPDTLVDTGKPL
jgi:hypothetical protein